MAGDAPVAVVDASVAVKWYLPERSHEKAIRLRDLHVRGSINLAAPTLIYYEVANALRYHRIFKLSPHDVATAVRALKALRIARMPVEAVWALASRISYDLDISMYDAVYVSMAASRQAPFITSDGTLAERMKMTGRNVTLLDDWKPD